MPTSTYLISCIWWNVDFVLFIFVPGERDQFCYLIFLPLSILGVLNKMTLHHQLEALLPTKSNYFPLWFFKSMVISKWVWYVINQVIFLAACVFDIWLQDKRYSLLGMSSEWGCIMPTSVHLWARMSSYLRALGKKFLQMIDASKQSQLSRKHPGFARTLRVRSFTKARADLGEILYMLLFPVNTSFPLAWAVWFLYLDWADHYRLSSAKLLSMLLTSVWS